MSNNLSSVIPLIFAQGLTALRSNCTMPRRVMNDFKAEVAEKGEVINVPMPSAIGVSDVVPGPYAPATGSISPQSAQIGLNNWKRAGFTLTDREVAQIISGVAPMELTAAIQSISEAVNQSILEQYRSVYNAVGTPGTTPFGADASVVTGAAKILNVAKVLKRDRYFIMGPDAEAAALGLPAFYQYYQSADKNVMQKGEIGEKYGFNFAMDQDIGAGSAGYQTAGTASGASTGAAVQPAGQNSVGSDNTTGSLSVTTGAGGEFAPNVGDLLQIAGVSGYFTVLAGAAIGASATGVYSIAPALPVAIAADSAVTIVASHVVNLAFQQQAFAFASRPMAGNTLSGGEPSDLSYSVPDPVSGLVLRLSTFRQYRQTVVEFDMLWGASVVRPEAAVRVMG